MTTDIPDALPERSEAEALYELETGTPARTTAVWA
jgi:hypothetical protein